MLVALACAEPRPERVDVASSPSDSTAPPEEPGWWATQLYGVGSADQQVENGSVVGVDGAWWVVFELGARDRSVHELYAAFLQRPGDRTDTLGSEGPPPLPFPLGGQQDHGSFVPAIAARSDRDELVVQRLVNCEVGPWSACGEVPVEVELDWIDRRSGAVRTEALAGPLDGLEKGRGAIALGADGYDACFKAKQPAPLDDEVWCVDAAGTWDNPSAASAESDDHPWVMRRDDGSRVVAFTTARDGARSSAISIGADPYLLDPPEVHAEDAMVVADGSTLHAVWSELAPDGRVVYARCDGPSCGSAGDWVQEVVATGSGPESPGIAWVAAEGVPAVAYTLDERVYVAVRCADGWRIERPYEAERPESTLHGQPVIAAADDGRLAVVYSVDTGSALWWAERSGPACP